MITVIGVRFVTTFLERFGTSPFPRKRTCSAVNRHWVVVLGLDLVLFISRELRKRLEERGTNSSDVSTLLAERLGSC